MNYNDYRVHKRLMNLSSDIIEKVYSLISEIDAVKNTFKISVSKVDQTIDRLTQSVIVTSSGSSNRIEGNKLSDDEIKSLYSKINIKKFKSRDEQEVVGYIECMQTIFDNYQDIKITESNILWLHEKMLARCDNDSNHRGKYKVGLNRVEARDPSRNVVGIIFDPTPPYLVKKEMIELIDWYNFAIETKAKHPLILTANFIFEYLAIHPFQDGNGRTSRLLSNVMMLRAGYDFVKIASHEKVIESNKAEYYKTLNFTQKTWKTDNEDVSQWLLFFLGAIKLQAESSLLLLQKDNFEETLSQKQMKIWNYIAKLDNREFTRSELISVSKIPARTVESIIKKFLDMNKITRLGQGRAIRYKIAKL